MTAPSDAQDKFMLRLPTGMREKLRAAATHNRRSMNAEIVFLLERGFEAVLRAATVEEARATFGDAAAEQLVAVYGICGPIKSWRSGPALATDDLRRIEE